MSLRQDIFLHYSRYLAKDVFRYAQIYLIKNRNLLRRPKRSVSTRDSRVECGFLKGSIRVAELRKQKKAPQRVLFFCFGGAGGRSTQDIFSRCSNLSYQKPKPFAPSETERLNKGQRGGVRVFEGFDPGRRTPKTEKSTTEGAFFLFWWSWREIDARYIFALLKSILSKTETFCAVRNGASQQGTAGRSAGF